MHSTKPKEIISDILYCFTLYRYRKWKYLYSSHIYLLCHQTAHTEMRLVCQKNDYQSSPNHLTSWTSHKELSHSLKHSVQANWSHAFNGHDGLSTTSKLFPCSAQQWLCTKAQEKLFQNSVLTLFWLHYSFLRSSENGSRRTVYDVKLLDLSLAQFQSSPIDTHFLSTAWVRVPMGQKLFTPWAIRMVKPLWKVKGVY